MKKSVLDIFIFALVVVGVFAIITGMYELILAVVFLGIVALVLKLAGKLRKK